ncbi:MAG: hypothetical protein ACYST6_16550, partial [Planctomycetota bacterium]
LSDQSSLNIGRWATAAIAFIAAAGTAAVPSIIDGLLICYTVWASAILPALIIGLWVARPRPLAGVLSMGVGTLVALGAIICMFVFPSVIGAPAIIVPALGASLLAYAIGHSLSRTKGGS